MPKMKVTSEVIEKTQTELEMECGRARVAEHAQRSAEARAVAEQEKEEALSAGAEPEEVVSDVVETDPNFVPGFGLKGKPLEPGLV